MYFLVGPTGIFCVNDLVVNYGHYYQITAVCVPFPSPMNRCVFTLQISAPYKNPPSLGLP